jgi:UDP-N-acetylglucosamine:LPS N-acetylglucosamine transferase
MGNLYAQSDMAIVRGGTTTLAECKLFDLPLIIVPLPVTHDQAKNAQFYVEKYQDICISQNSDTFEQSLYESIIKTQKKYNLFDLQKTKVIIQKAKTIILDMMLLS